MGTIYKAICRDCKVVRDLDKFYTCRRAESRQEVLDLSEDIKDAHLFNASLLVSFMAEHMGHNCTVLTDLYDESSDPALSKELVKFWS